MPDRSSPSVPPRPPLTLRQALEEEFVQLHGGLPPDYQAESDILRAGPGPRCSEWAERDRKLLRRLYQCIHRLDKEDRHRRPRSVDAPDVSDPDFEASRDVRKPRSALCLSGGGIRSATFGLGVLQALASRGLLSQFDFLSTVSGGGFVGSWLSAWIHRCPDGAAGVGRQLNLSSANGPSLEVREQEVNASTPACGEHAARPNAGGARPQERTEDEEPAETVESEAVHHLRQYSNYLTPRLGVFSGDAWTVAATYLRNLLLNWMVLIPFVVGVLLLPHVFKELLTARPAKGDPLSLFVMSLSLLWFVSLIASVTWLPSVGRASPGRAGAVHPAAGETSDAPFASPAMRSQVYLWGVAPIVISCVATALLIVWGGPSQPSAHPAGPTSPPWQSDPGFNLVLTVALYLAAALAVRAIAQWRRSPNPPRPVRLYATFAALGTIVFLLLRIVRIPLSAGGFWAHPKLYVCFAVPTAIGLYLLLLTFYVGLTSWDSHPYADEDREWWARLMGVFLLSGGVWIVVTLIAMYGPTVFGAAFHTRWFGLLSGALSVVTAAIGLIGGRSATTGPQRESMPDSLRARLAALLPTLCAQVFLLIVLLAISAAVEPLAEAVARNHLTQGGLLAGRLPSKLQEALALSGAVAGGGVAAIRVLLLTAGMFGAVMLFGRLINVNRLSLHAMYRNRLIRAYLGASNPVRCPNPFTGFDPSDNIPMHQLRRRQRFSLEDLVGQRHDGRPPNFDRVVKLAKLWLGRNTAFARYMWETMDRRTQTLLLSEDARVTAARKHREDASGARPDIPHGPEPELDGRRLADAVLEHLNRLTADPGLVSHSLFANASERAKDPELDAVYRNIETDGCTHLLNRLVLERECVWDEQIAPVNPGPTAEGGGGGGGGGSRDRVAGSRADKLLGGSHPPKPFHLVNAALNLVHGRNLAWQQRKAASFTISPLHCGFDRGFRPSVQYANGITLGTAVTISGAAASPNMGNHSSPAVTFLLTLFNVRLGWWLGNPAEVTIFNARQRLLRWIADFPFWSRGGGRDDERAPYRLQSPRHPLRPVFDEAFGRTDEDNDYVYLSDGGHFENLGLYEMVRRRCRYIFVSDASCDPKGDLSDLGNAIRKIRIDMGVPIEIHNVFFPQCARFASKACAIGRIRYTQVDEGPGVEDGILIYLKPAMSTPDPVDVYNYAAASGQFPHEPTADQWFTESQFESYRKLGETLAGSAVDAVRERLMGPDGKPDITAFFEGINGKQQPNTAAPTAVEAAAGITTAAAATEPASTPESPQTATPEVFPNPEHVDVAPKSPTSAATPCAGDSAATDADQVGGNAQPLNHKLKKPMPDSGKKSPVKHTAAPPAGKKSK